VTSLIHPHPHPPSILPAPLSISVHSPLPSRPIHPLLNPPCRHYPRPEGTFMSQESCP
jgi:hypothetical protein